MWSSLVGVVCWVHGRQELAVSSDELNLDLTLLWIGVPLENRLVKLLDWTDWKQVSC